MFAAPDKHPMRGKPPMTNITYSISKSALVKIGRVTQAQLNCSIQAHWLEPLPMFSLRVNITIIRKLGKEGEVSTLSMGSPISKPT